MAYKLLPSRVNGLFWIWPLLCCFLFTSCSTKPWGDALDEEATRNAQHLVRAIQQQEEKCFKSFDADMSMFWESPAGDKAIAGYLILQAPSSLRYVISNPLGQPVFAFSGNGKVFQMLQTTEKTHVRGNVRSIALRNRIPLLLAQGDWFAYLSGRLPARKLTVIEAAQDSSSQTLWLQVATPKSRYVTGSVHLQIDPATKELLSYLFLDDDGDTMAVIEYPKKTGQHPCRVATTTAISGLPWGSLVTIELDTISGFDHFGPKDFTLPVPEGYQTQLWP